MDALRQVREVTSEGQGKEPPGQGWPRGFFERFAGGLPDFPDIEPEGDF
jgi:hypothetical protein